MRQTAFVPFEEFFIEHIKQTSQSHMTVHHYHDTYEVYLHLSGERRLFLDDICYTLKKGDLAILKPFELHYTERGNSNYYERYVLNFSPKNLSFFLSEAEIHILFEKLDSCVVHLNNEHFQTIYDSFKQINKFAEHKSFLSQKLLYSAIFQLIMEILDLPEKNEVTISHSVPTEIVTVIHYMNKHYQENIDLDSLSLLAHMSKYHFCRVFHQSTGATFLEYLYNVRLTKVHRLLLDTKIPLKEIASKTGFSSTAHLSRVFRQVYQVSPREFRKSSQKELI